MVPRHSVQFKKVRLRSLGLVGEGPRRAVPGKIGGVDYVPVGRYRGTEALTSAFSGEALVPVGSDTFHVIARSSRFRDTNSMRRASLVLPAETLVAFPGALPVFLV